MAAVLAGGDSFAQFCAPCHGRDGAGTGAVLAPILVDRPPNLTLLSQMNGGRFPFEEVGAALYSQEPHGQTLIAFQDGRMVAMRRPSQMPDWGVTFLGIDETPAAVNARIANLIVYLESIQQALL